MEASEGLIIVYARLRRPDIRDEFWAHMENIPGERVTQTVYELSIADWDEGGWQEEVEWMQQLLSGTRESVIIWQFSGGKFNRYTVSASD